MNAKIVNYKGYGLLVEEALRHPSCGGRGGRWRRVLHIRIAGLIAAQARRHPLTRAASAQLPHPAFSAKRIVAKRRSRMGSCDAPY
jgi:hypothetical protein